MDNDHSRIMTLGNQCRCDNQSINQLRESLDMFSTPVTAKDTFFNANILLLEGTPTTFPVCTRTSESPLLLQ